MSDDLPSDHPLRQRREVFSVHGSFWTSCENYCREGENAQICGYMQGDYGWTEIALRPDIKCKCKCHEVKK